MEKKFGDTALDIIFSDVFKISEDMLALVHKIVSDNSKYESAFSNMKVALEEIHKNLKTYLLGKRWIKGKGRKRNASKDYQTEELIKMCQEYQVKCHDIAEEMIKITEKIEKNRKMRDVLKNLVAKLEEKKNAQESCEDESEEPEEEDPGPESEEE